ncbi:MAG: hypothetical protein B7X36_13295, partial [Thiomonas sp. 14-64-326]
MGQETQARVADSWCEDIAQWAEHLPLMAACFDAHSRLLYCNTAYANWLGKTPAELLGKSLDALVPHETLVT